MKGNDFCHWLEGFLDHRDVGLTEKEVALILSKIKLVTGEQFPAYPFPEYKSNLDFYRDNKWVDDRFNNSNLLIREPF